MADDDDNVIPFGPRVEITLDDGGELADALLEDCIGEYEDVIVIGFSSDGETTVSGTLSNIADVYDALAGAAQNIASAHLDMLFRGVEH